VLQLHRFQKRCPDIDVRISATNEVVDLTRRDFDPAIRCGLGRYPGLTVKLLMQNEVFPACSPQLLKSGPPLNSPDDLRHHALIHDQAVDRDPLVPTWAMWLKAAGVPEAPVHSGLSFSTGHLTLEAALAGHGVVPAYTYSTIAAADLAANRLVRLYSLPDLFAYYVKALTRKAATRALDGDPAALRLCLESILAAPRVTGAAGPAADP